MLIIDILTSRSSAYIKNNDHALAIFDSDEVLDKFDAHNLRAITSRAYAYKA